MHKKILEIARKMGFDDAVYVGKYKSMDIWMPTHNDNILRFIGNGYLAVKSDGTIETYWNCDMSDEITAAFCG